ncbi:MAG: HAMP domain-containing protein, partial [Chloroflexi bacterium]|nr:HAMP domain-containing protein [Chloroflexota bacterium]
MAIGSAVALTIAASLVGWISFNSVGEAQSTVNEDSLPEVVAAFGVAQNSGTLVNAAPLLTVSTSPEELADVSADIEDARISLDQHLAVLLGADMSRETTIISLQRLPDIPGLTDILNLGDVQVSDDEGDTSGHVRSQVDTLTIGIGAIESGMTEIFEINEHKDALRDELATLRGQIDDVMVPAVDNQLFYTMTGYRNLGDAPAERAEHFSEAELARYRSLAGLHTDATTASQILESSFSVSSSPQIEPLRERFESAASSMDRNLAALDDWPYRPQILPLINRLVELGTGKDNGFDLLERQLVIKQQQQDLLALNRAIASTLVQEVDALVESARTSADEATLTSTQAILTGRTLLLAISAVSIVGALIAWLFVGRILLRRLWRLHDRMLEMAGGDLETAVELDGRDEVADMARALEVFRRNSLEAQRLNLVEELADELLNKNEELESVLADLERAQDQIVVREKLAALGELTAGVAHEIRNPLNFVKNFSEASEELLDELGELLTDVADDLDEEDKDYLEEITGDLTGNMERIRTHGDRANRIVNDMLMMGRDTGEQRLTDINSLLDEHARLAYHSARALDSEFQLGIERDLDPNMGEVNVVPRAWGRVFLNMVGNACDATDEKRRTIDAEIAAEERPADSEPYMPTLWITTHKGDVNIQVRIRDNGSGMPPDIIDKIFNPFFTTKPTDKGTGLGLAISNDIVRQH